MDRFTYWGEGSGYVCIDERMLDGYANPHCGEPVHAGFGCVRWEAL